MGLELINYQLSNCMEETEDKPKMIEVFVEGRAFQQAFCFMIAFDDRGRNEPLMLATVIGGADSTMQSIKGVIDTGISGLSFGYGTTNIVPLNHRLLPFLQHPYYAIHLLHNNSHNYRQWCYNFHIYNCYQTLFHQILLDLN